LFAIVLLCQLTLLVYHQVTTLVDFSPFNGSRNYTRTGKGARVRRQRRSHGAPAHRFRSWHLRAHDFWRHLLVLFVIELLIWWIPYLTVPSGRWLDVYNRLLSVATLDFGEGDLSARWRDTYNRLHRGTITVLPARGDRPVPNPEDTILHADCRDPHGVAFALSWRN
jgi:hypothetical protein